MGSQKFHKSPGILRIGSSAQYLEETEGGGFIHDDCTFLSLMSPGAMRKQVEMQDRITQMRGCSCKSLVAAVGRL